jgi:hypothetical protein
MHPNVNSDFHILIQINCNKISEGLVYKEYNAAEKFQYLRLEIFRIW